LDDNIDSSIILAVGDAKRCAKGRALIDDIVEKYPDASILKAADLHQLYSDRVRLMENNTIHYIDDDHLSESGAPKVNPRLRSTMTEIIYLDK
jgi:hypothetical protein